MDTATFVWYITEQLAPTLRPGQVVVLDNLSIHKAASIRQVIEARQCTLLFLPCAGYFLNLLIKRGG
jgi:transposase